MKALELNNLVVLARMEAKGYFKNSSEFAQKKYEEHLQKITELSNMVYNSYLPKGEKIAKERKELYILQNLQKVSDFI